MCQFSVNTDIFSLFWPSIPEIPYVPIFRQNDQLWIFGPKFAQKWILGLEFQKSNSGFGINTSNIPCVPIFSQDGQLLILWPKFGEIAQLRAIFWFKYFESVGESLVEAEMSWVEVDELDGGWNELGWGGWSWVEVGARFSYTQLKRRFHFHVATHVMCPWRFISLTSLHQLFF